jgi:hypothetical protein
MIKKYNFLGLFKDYPSYSDEVRKIIYMKKYKNTLINLDDKGSFYFSRLLRRIRRKSQEKDNFVYFHHIIISGRSYYIPADLSKQHPETNEALLLAVINNDLRFIMEFDYSKYQDSMTELMNYYDNILKEKAKKNYSVHYTPEDKLKYEYSNFMPNRDFSDRLYENTLRRLDGHDGTYIDNGYR